MVYLAVLDETLFNFILDNTIPDYQEFIASDLNFDDTLDILDAVEIINIILQID